MKAEDNQFPHVTLAEQSSAPATPAAGLGLIYEKADGKLYFLNDAGLEVQLGTAVAALTVQDENTNVSTAVTQIDFQGAGVSVTNGTGEVVVTIPGGGSGGGDSAFTAPTLTNSWASSAPGYSPAGYLKDASGFVHIRGLVTGGAALSSCFTLPTGYRPGFKMQGNGTEVQLNGQVLCLSTGQKDLSFIPPFLAEA